MLVKEMNETAIAIRAELEKDEMGSMLEWNNAVEGNFPPAAILIAGVVSFGQPRKNPVLVKAAREEKRYCF